LAIEERVRLRAALRECKFGRVSYFVSDPEQPSENVGLVIGHLTSREASGWSDLFDGTSVCLGTADTSLEAPIGPVAADMIEQSGALHRTGALQLLGGSRSGVYTVVSAYYQAQMVKPRPVRVVLLSPLLKVWPEMKNLKHPAYRTLIQRAEKDPAVVEHLERDGDAVKVMERIQEENLDVKFTVVLGKDHMRDMRDTDRTRHFPNVRVIELDTDEHLTFFWLKTRIDQPNAIKRALELTARNNWPKLTPPQVTVKAAKTVEQIIRLRREYGDLRKLYADMDRVPA
jgi:hypothetical protein